MSAKNCNLHRRGNERGRRSGVAYILVLSAGMLLAVIGFGILTAGRASSRGAGQLADIDEASVLAESGVEWAMAAIANNTSWRTAYSSGVETTPKSMGRGTISFKLVDETDGNLSNNTSDAVRVYGIGRVGSATRIYSVQLTGTGPALDVLKNPVHAGGNLSVILPLTVTSGPLSTNGTANVSSTLTGDLDAITSNITGSGSVTGTVKILTAAKTMPAATVFDTYKAGATAILFTAISSGTITSAVLSSASNPYGSVSPTGVYYIHVPSGGTLTITKSRILATLIVEVDSGGKLMTSSTFAWDPPRADYPSLIVKATNGSTVSFAGSTSALSEVTTLTNFNPPGTPDASGNTDSDILDTYPTEFHGVMQIIGTGFTTTFSTNFVMKGAAMVEGNVSFSTGVKLTADPTLSTNPPAGYTNVANMIPVSGSYKWESAP